MLGNEIGKNIALRILRDFDERPYAEIASDEIRKGITALEPVISKKASAMAYDIVDRNKQLKLAPDKRNNDIWWDSKVVLSDERYVFKRSMNVGPRINPWLVPESNLLGCREDLQGKTLKVPEITKNGDSFYSYYEFSINPDAALFYSKITGKQLHSPFPPFSTRNIVPIVEHVQKEMEEKLLPGFDQRNKYDPIPSYKRLRKVFFK